MEDVEIMEKGLTVLKAAAKDYRHKPAGGTVDQQSCRAHGGLLQLNPDDTDTGGHRSSYVTTKSNGIICIQIKMYFQKRTVLNKTRPVMLFREATVWIC